MTIINSYLAKQLIGCPRKHGYTLVKATFIFSFCRREILVIRKISAFQASMKNTSSTTSRLTSLLIFVAYLVSGHSLTTVSVFLIFAYATVLGYFAKYLGRRLGPLFDCNMSIWRIQTFLETVENYGLDTNFAVGTISNQIKKQRHQLKPRVSLTGLCCNVDKTKSLLKNVHISTEGPQIVTITGPVGSGKTSLLLAILGELPICKGHVERRGKVAFVGQSPWVFPGTLRDNVTFNKPFNSTKFQKIIEACALSKDIEQFPDGELTTVGERGIVLSGGQRARVSMARALYSDADIYLLDDPLSCVDAQVGNHIFQEYVQHALRDRLCFFVTHQPCFIKDANHIIVMDKGSIVWQGSYSEIAGNAGLENIFKSKDSVNKITQCGSTERESCNQSKGSGETSLIIPEEDRNFGSVSYKTYWKYIRAGLPVYLMILLAFLCNSALGEWSNSPGTR